MRDLSCHLLQKKDVLGRYSLQWCRMYSFRDSSGNVCLGFYLDMKKIRTRGGTCSVEYDSFGNARVSSGPGTSLCAIQRGLNS